MQVSYKKLEKSVIFITVTSGVLLPDKTKTRPMSNTCHDRESLLLYPKPISRYTSHERPPNKPSTSKLHPWYNTPTSINSLLLSLLPKQTQGHQTISLFTHSGKLLRTIHNAVGNTVYFKASTRGWPHYPSVALKMGKLFPIPLTSN